jgi:hypothetical protein
MDDKVYFTINEPQGPQGQQVYKSDYSEDVAVKPNADPNIVSSAQKLMKIQAMGSLLQLQTINPQVYTKRFLEAIDVENISELMHYQAPPNPDQQKMQAELAIKQQDSQAKMQLEQMKAQLDAKSKEMEMKFKEFELMLKAKEQEVTLRGKMQEHQLNMQAGAQEHAQNMQMGAQEHVQNQQMAQEKHQAGIQQMKEKAKEKPSGHNQK